jgi:malonyl-CoA O-methyltransferase
MSADTTRVARAFRRGLPSYGHDARAQARIASRLGLMMQQAGITGPARALEFGCGTGFLTRRLIGDIRPEWLVLNDLLPESEDQLASILAETGQAGRFEAGPIQSLPLPENLDLIASASTIQWLEDLPGQILRLCDHLAPGGWLALSGFGPEQFHELSALGSTAQAPSYVSAQDLAASLPPGMTPVAVTAHHIRLAFPDARAVLRHLRSTGVNAQAGTPWSRKKLRDFEEAYRGKFGRGTALPLTYHPVYVVAKKA